LQAVENMCSHKMASVLYEELRVVCESHVQANVGVFLNDTSGDNTQFLKTLDKCWQDHCRQMVRPRLQFSLQCSS
jgi:cullin-4